MRRRRRGRGRGGKEGRAGLLPSSSLYTLLLTSLSSLPLCLLHCWAGRGRRHRFIFSLRLCHLSLWHLSPHILPAMPLLPVHIHPHPPAHTHSCPHACTPYLIACMRTFRTSCLPLMPCLFSSAPHAFSHSPAHHTHTALSAPCLPLPSCPYLCLPATSALTPLFGGGGGTHETGQGIFLCHMPSVSCFCTPLFACPSFLPLTPLHTHMLPPHCTCLLHASCCPHTHIFLTYLVTSPHSSLCYLYLYLCLPPFITSSFLFGSGHFEDRLRTDETDRQTLFVR